MSSLHQTHKLRNQLHSMLLLSAMLLLLLSLCTSLFGSNGLLLMLFASALLLFTPRASAWLTLRLHRARPLSFDEAPQLYRIVDRLADRAELPAHPLLFYIPSATPNAFAMSERGQPLIAVTEGLLHQLDQQQLTAVLAHEISHIRNGDLQVMMIAEMLNRLTASLSTTGWIMLLIFLPLWMVSDLPLPWLAIGLLLTAPLAATLLQLALSRTREFDADLEAARLTGNPQALASALVSIDRFGANWWSLLLPNRGRPSDAWVRTHPSTAERVRRLRQLAVEQQQTASPWHPFLTPAPLLTIPAPHHGFRGWRW